MIYPSFKVSPAAHWNGHYPDAVDWDLAIVELSGKYFSEHVPGLHSKSPEAAELHLSDDLPEDA